MSRDRIAAVRQDAMRAMARVVEDDFGDLDAYVFDDDCTYAVMLDALVAAGFGSLPPGMTAEKLDKAAQAAHAGSYYALGEDLQEWAHVLDGGTP